MTSNKPLIQHIPEFLDYCRNEGLKENTQKNYQQYINKFTGWLTHGGLAGLLPHQLTLDHITAYQSYLSHYQNPKNGKTLKKGTQNYYLIALKALLSYFSAKGILSINSSKIGLPKADKGLKNRNYPTLNQLDALLNTNSGKSVLLLRNQAILHTIIATGLKIGQITKLNRESIENLPKDVLPIIKIYLKTRNDKERALFINYHGPKNASRRLTPRMIQRIIKSYGKTAGLHSSTTPETLRSARIIATWNKEIEMKDIPWMEAEKNIAAWTQLIKENISLLPEGYKSNSPLATIVKCDDCIN